MDENRDNVYQPTADDAGVPDLEPPRVRKSRRPIISVAIVAVSLWLLWSTREQTKYFLSSRQPLELDDASQAVAGGLLRRNTFVRVSGTPDRKRAIVIEGRWGGYKGLFPLLRTRGRLWVAEPRSDKEPKPVLNESFSGRLVLFKKQSFFAQVSGYYAEKITASFDLDPADLARQAGKAPAEVRDRTGDVVELSADRILIFGVRFPDDYRIQLDRTRYPKREEADKLVAGFALPWIALPESHVHWSYVVHAEGTAAEALVNRFRDLQLDVGVVPRTDSVAARWADVATGAGGSSLVIRAARGSVPETYQVVDGQLVAAPAVLPIEIPISRILSAEVTAPYRVPDDAFLLVEGDSPSTLWWFFAMDVLLLIVIVGNIAVLVLRLRRSSRQTA